MSRVSIILRTISSVLLTTLIAATAQAQRDFDPLNGSGFEISGEVRSAANKTLDNVLVRVESVTGVLVDQTTTDGMGKFRFSRLGAGQYRVVANSPGRGTGAQAVDLALSSPRVNVVLQLIPQPPTFPSGDVVGVIDARVPSEAKAALEKGRAALAEQKTDVAKSYFEKAAKIFPDYYDAYMLLGQLHMDASNWQKAEASFREAVRTNPKVVTALVSLAEAYRREKKFSEAQKSLEDALRLDNNSWQSNFTLGRIHWELNDIVKAGKYIARTIELAPNVAEAHLLAGNIFVRAGLPTNALVEYEEYLRLAPKGEFAPQVQALADKLKKSLPSKIK